jgi:hypothetical protein
MSSEYVFVDKEGNVLARKPKGRGRPLTGALEKEPGKWFVIGFPKEPIIVKNHTSPATTTPKEASTLAPETSTEEKPPTIPLEEDKPSLEEKTEHEVEIRPIYKDVDKPISVEDFRKCCFPIREPSRQGDKTIFSGVYMLGHCGLEGIAYNNVYHEITIDETAKTITFLSLPGHRPIVFRNAI